VPIQAIERAAAILRELDGGRSLRLNELCDRLGLAKGTTHGLLKALQGEGLVVQERSSGRYQLGPGLLLLGRSYLNVSEARTIALSWTSRLVASTGEEARVAIPFQGVALVVHQLAPTGDLLQHLEIGVGLPLHATALGKCLLAYRAELPQGSFEPVTQRTITEARTLRRELGAVLSQSWAVEREEFEVGVAAVAAPVFDGDGAVAGAVGLSGPMQRLLTPRAEPRAGLAMQVCAVARAMSRDLGATRWPVTPEPDERSP
jgi:DNA-binding IclR family transcriptional regulator